MDKMGGKVFFANHVYTCILYFQKMRILTFVQKQRWEFIKESKKVRIQEFEQESDQENKEENKNSTKKAAKKK